MTASISVITVVRDRADVIGACLDSVKEQDFRRVEHVVVDGASTDGTLGILHQRKEQIDVLASERDDGPYHALNKGLALASGDYVGLLHSDDQFAASDTLSRVAEQMRTHDSDCLYGDVVYVKRHEGRPSVVRRWVAGQFDRRRFRYGWMPPHPTVFIKRSLIAEVGGYNPRFGTSADYEFLLRHLYVNRARTTYAARTIVEMKLGGLSNSSLRTRLRANAMDRRAWELHGLRPSWCFRLLKPARKLPQFVQLAPGHGPSE